MGKIYDKSELTIVEGRLVNKDNEIVNISPTIVRQANDLETLVQKAEYLKGQPEEQKAPSLDGFERKTEKKFPEFRCDTPIMDAKVEDAVEFMKELDGVKEVKVMNVMLERYHELVEFVKSDKVFDAPHDWTFTEMKFDTPTLGNILEWPKSAVEEAIAFAFGYGVDDE